MIAKFWLLDLLGSSQKPRSHRRLWTVVGLSGDSRKPAKVKRGAVCTAN